MHALIEQLAPHFGSHQLLTGDTVDARFLHDWMVTMPQGAPLAVARPKTTAEVSLVLAACHAHGVAVVPQGGLTGLAGGAVPVDAGVVLNLELMQGIEEIDTAASTMTVWAGTTLQAVQEAASAAGLFFPLDIGGRGSCRIGGNVATNAGGNRVLRFGMARESVLGMEVVLADGTVITSLNKMLKNNAGYDLKQLFIGSEGTLGVVTRLVLRLQALPRSRCTALCALADYAAVLELLGHVRSRLPGSLSAFEWMHPDFYERVTNGVAGLTTPLPCRNSAGQHHGAYVLVEALGGDQASDQAMFEAVLGEALENGLVTDAVVAQSESETAALWRVRDASGEFRQVFWPHVGFDVSIPTGEIGRFVEQLTAQLHTRWPEVETVFFGHIGDANIHIGVKVGAGEQPEQAIEALVYELVGQWRGSVSAEHGIGLLKKPYLGHSRSAEEIALMRRVKAALDPKGILNPGKVFDASPTENSPNP